MRGKHDNWIMKAEDYTFPRNVIIGAVKALRARHWHESNPEQAPPPFSTTIPSKIATTACTHTMHASCTPLVWEDYVTKYRRIDPTSKNAP